MEEPLWKIDGGGEDPDLAAEREREEEKKAELEREKIAEEWTEYLKTAQPMDPVYGKETGVNLEGTSNFEEPQN